MAGKTCTGAATNNAFLPHQSRAFCEGLAFRAQGTAVAYPKANGPHEGTGSEAETAWEAGWDVAHAAAASTVSPSDAPCCSVPQNTISA